MINLEECKKISRICLNCKNPLCVAACPLHNPIPKILTLIREDKLDDASQLLSDNTNGSIICSKLCDIDKQCYGNCILNKRGQGVEFFKVEEYLAYNFRKKYKPSQIPKKAKVAVIGAGISGISCAIDLSLAGYDVTIYEKENKIGGVITDSLPDFRFDSNIINYYEKALSELGIIVKYNYIWGDNLKFRDLEEYQYIILALGTQISKKTLPMHENVLDALTILKKYRKKISLFENKNVLVVGGGNIAMDVARVLNKLCNKVSIVYRRDVNNAPASKREINMVIEEGIEFKSCLAPSELIIKNGKLIGLKTEKMNLIKDETSTRLNFKQTGEFIDLDCDYIVEAIGLNADYNYTKDVFPELFNQNGWIDENQVIIKNNQVILATGDYLTGATSFANALNIAKMTIRKVLEND